MAQPLLHLMHLVSPALPVGAYAYSQGLEYAIESGIVHDEASLKDWIRGILHNGLLYLDLPVLGRAMAAWRVRDLEQLNHWNRFLRANRETSELLLEDEQLGMALTRLLQALPVAQAQDLAFDDSPSFAMAFALAAVHWHVPAHDALRGFAWSWLENQVAAATKLVPLGQTHAQKILLELMADVDSVCDNVDAIEDEDLGLSLPGLALVSAQHERQYSRLFRS